MDSAGSPLGLTAVNAGHPTPQMSPGSGLARTSSFILLRQMPDAHCLALVVHR